MSASTKIGHGLAKGLGIKLQYRNELDEDIRRGESVFSSTTSDTYVEEEPRSIDWIKSVTPTRRTWINYVISLFPFLHWIDRYNLQWLAGDLVAGMYYLTRIFITIEILIYCKVSPLAESLSLRAWHTLLWPIFPSSMDSTLLSWESSSIGFSQLPRILPLV
jgi:sodium-independent sulfate anion transporter 11